MHTYHLPAVVRVAKRSPISLFVALVFALLPVAAGAVHGQVLLVLKNGMELRGKIAPLADIGGNVEAQSSTGAVSLQLIILVDNGLTRTFVSTYQKHNLLDDIQHFERIELKQPVSTYGPGVGQMGNVLRIGPFNDHGQRTFTMQSEQGPVTILQGITEVTPLWTTLQALRATPAVQWESRIATSSIPQETLSEILQNHAPDNSPDRQLAIVRLLIDGERYHDAEKQLRETLHAFPKLTDLKKQLTELRQLKSRQWLKEIKRMQAAGQHRQAWTLLKSFPTDNVAGQLLVEVHELLSEYDNNAARGQRIMADYASFIEQLQDENQKQRARNVETEMLAELSLNTIDRLIDFDRLRQDESLSAEQKVSLAISGWILGNGSGTENIGVAMALVDVRRLVIEYLRTTPDQQAERERIVQELTSYEGSDPTRVAKILEHLKPPLLTAELAAEPAADNAATGGIRDASFAEKESSPAADELPPGFYRKTVAGLNADQAFEYVVQLPPEYDPYRKYPTIVSLHAAGSTPEMQINWWAGDYRSAAKRRYGQATRHGYIVIAPAWAVAGQTRYNYTAQEHAAVLYALQDAMKHFSVDADRVFLSGISTGGDAAWDIGLSHPDLWAGVLPVVAAARYDTPTAPNYVTRYWHNAQHVPLYFVAGEMDVQRNALNALDWNRYLTRPHFDVMVTEYKGRGHEHFSDDIHNMFTWMNNHRRVATPVEFEVMTMRSWDNFFWWFEIDRFPDRFLVGPTEWPTRGRAAAPTEVKRVSPNYFTLKTPAEQITMWLTPDLVDFNQPIRVHAGGRSLTEELRPDLTTLLEDARTRGDRQHPFWAKWTVELKKP